VMAADESAEAVLNLTRGLREALDG
jgi:hypothetical protein